VGDGYVHRLIQSNADGKLVEVPSPAPAQAVARASQTNSSASAGPSGKVQSGEENRCAAHGAAHGDAAGSLAEAQMIEVGGQGSQVMG